MLCSFGTSTEASAPAVLSLSMSYRIVGHFCEVQHFLKAEQLTRKLKLGILPRTSNLHEKLLFH